AVPQIINEAAIAYSNSGGQTSVPIIFHMLHGVRGAGGVQHSGSPQPWYWNTPGLQVVEPGTPADVKGLFRWAALKSKNPTVILADEGFASLKAPIKRVSTMPVPVPYAPTTEDYVTPSAERIVAAVREVVGR